jgi:Predicted esterase of the alpha-beta hydrolase superfamily
VFDKLSAFSCSSTLLISQLGQWSYLGKESLISMKNESSLFGTWNPGNISEHDVAISWETVIEEEARYLKDQNDRRVKAGRRTDPFALAFSGGGIRAAAFQAGVLWRLAKSNMLKDVDYLAAVSGGGYIASAFTSFLHGEIPKDGDRTNYFNFPNVLPCRLFRTVRRFFCLHRHSRLFAIGYMEGQVEGVSASARKWWIS